MKKLIIPILFLVACTNKPKETKQSYELEILKMDMVLKHNLELMDYYLLVGSRYDYDKIKTYRAYCADSLALSPENKIKYINNDDVVDMSGAKVTSQNNDSIIFYLLPEIK